MSALKTTRTVETFFMSQQTRKLFGILCKKREEEGEKKSRGCFLTFWLS